MPLEFRIVAAQSCIVLAVTATFLVAGFGALSVLLGGGVAVFATGYAALANYRGRRRVTNAKGVWRSMVAIELQRMLLTAALCVSVFVLYPDLNAGAFFAGLIAAVAAYFLAPWLGSESSAGNDSSERRASDEQGEQ